MYRKLAITLAGLSALAVAPWAMAEHEGAAYDYARVVNVEPIVRYVRVETPVRECWDEEVHEGAPYGRHHGHGTAGPTIAGGILGGVIGHQFGSGRGKDAATVAGVLIGSAIAHDRAARRRSPAYYETRSRTVERCDVRYETHEEERIDGYRVTYEYNGRVQTTRMPYDPGKQIKVRVSVSPVKY